MKLPQKDLIKLINDVLPFAWPMIPIDKSFILAQIYIESNGDTEARSGVGALGLMQLMPATALDMGLDNVNNLKEPAINIHYGITYLRQQYERFPEIPMEGRLQCALASYNGGRGYVNRALKLTKLDGETRWWQWDVWKFWLMHRDCYVMRSSSVSDRKYPDYKQIWGYVDKIYNKQIEITK